MGAVDLSAELGRAQNAILDNWRFDRDNWPDSQIDAAYQIALSEIANAHEIEMWEMQNRYNTPAAQMARFAEAGLNPMLVYQQGNPGNASSAPGTHVPNVRLTPNADKQAEINNVLNIISAVSGAIGQVFGTIDQGLDLAIKQNDLRWSNFQVSGAKHILGNNWVNNPIYDPSVISADLDPSNPLFNPQGFAALSRLGLTNYYPKSITAEANAELVGKRTEYQDWYNSQYAPLLEEFMQGKLDIQDFEKKQTEYQQQMLEMLPPWARALIVPIFDYIRPFINSLLRR